METTAQLIKMDNNGKLYVPAWLRREMGLNVGEKFEVLMGEGCIIFKPYQRKGE